MNYKNCLFCEKNFFTKAHNSKYCSKICGSKHYEQINKERIANRKKKYYILNKNLIKNNEKKYRDNNKESIKLRKKNYYLKNKEQIYEKRKFYLLDNREKTREYFKNWKKNKRLNDINFRILDSLRSRLNQVLRKNKKTNNTIDLVGCDLDYLKKIFRV